MPASVRPAEHPRPELLLLGTDVGYVVDYNHTGVLAGAYRFVDQEVIRRYAEIIAQIYAGGTDFYSFFEASIAPLPEPSVTN